MASLSYLFYCWFTMGGLLGPPPTPPPTLPEGGVVAQPATRPKTVPVRMVEKIIFFMAYTLQ